MKYYFSFCCLLVLAMPTQGQYLLPDTSIKVFQEGKFLNQPWVGAMNQPQFSLADFDADGQDEMLVFDREGGAPRVFFWNQALQSWRWMPGKGKFFPQNPSWVLATDLNCDLWPDLIVGTPDSNTASIWLGSGEFLWDSTGILTTTAGEPAYVLKGDIPAIGDVDDDGDIDLLSMNEAGTQVALYERQGDCDSLSFVLTNECWGGFSEGGLNSQIFLNVSCFTGGGDPISETNGLHAGSTLTLVDVDGDDLLDLLIGDINQNTVTYLHNGGVPQFAVMDAVTVGFPTSAQSVQLKLFPAIYAGDFDQDGDTDLLASPNDVVVGRNREQIWWYENQGSGAALSLQLQHTHWLGEEMIDVGERSHPAFCDINGDGLQDMIIGNFSLREDNETSTSSLRYYLNTGSNNVPAFDLLDDDWLSISKTFNPAIFGLAPAFGDVDMDGDQDMVLGEQDGKLHLFLNTAGAGNPAFFVLDAVGFLGIDVGKDAVPILEDLTGDGMPDLLIGSQDGILYALENTNATPGVISFGAVVQDAGQLSGTLGENLAPTILLNASGQQELILGTREGWLRRMGNVTNNLSGAFTLVDSAYGNLPLVPYGSPSVFEIDQASTFLFLGNWQGGIQVLRNEGVNSISSASLTEGFLQAELIDQHLFLDFASPLPYSGQVTVTTVAGSSIFRARLSKGTESHEFSLPRLSTGIYLVSFVSTEGFWSKKILYRN